MPSTEFNNKDKQRRLVRRTLTGAPTYFAHWSRKSDEESIQRCELLLAELRTKKVEYEQIINEILYLISEESAEEEKKKEDALFKDIDEMTFEVISLSGKINSFLKSCGARNPRESIASFESSSSQSPVSDIRLPKIQIPKFDEDPRKFLKFKSLFSNLIHEDTSIPNVRKLYYLQEALEGAAEEFIRDVDLTDTSYNSAWSELLNRYENKRVIIRAHLADLFGIKKVKDESGVRSLLDSVTASLRGLKSCGENPDQWSTILSYLVSSKLDEVTKRDFENSIDDKKVYPSFKDLRKFLETRACAIEERKGLTLYDKSKNQPSTSSSNKSKPKSESSKKSFATGSSASPISSKCYACDSHHLLIECKVFLGKTPSEHYSLIRKNQLCANCFGKNHKSFDCKRSSCKKCQQKHHTLLHFECSVDQPKKDEKSAESEKPKNPDTIKTCSVASIGGPILLPTAVVHYRCRSKAGFARILTDPASEVTMIGDSFVRKHRLANYKSSEVVTVEGVGSDPVICDKRCKITLRSRIAAFEINIDCWIVPSKAIKYVVNVEEIKALNIEMPNIEFAEAKLPYDSTDIIIGAEYVEDYLLNETVKVDRITLRKSQFGWLALGKANEFNPINQSKPRISHSTTLVSIERYMKRLFDDEQFDAELSSTAEQLECVKHFESTYTRDSEGRFSIQYPKKSNSNLLSNMKSSALNSVDRILRKEPEVVMEYHKFIREYEHLEHLSFIECSEVEANEKYIQYYLPQLLVLRPDKSTTKVRVVFNASFKGKNGRSLNDILMVGPTLQLDLFDIILRFRRHNIAFVADIEKMYRQILVDPNDRPLQKIFYKESPNAKPKIGILNTLTYSTVPASFIATKCLFVLVDSIAESKPNYADIIKKDFYMDDLIMGCDTVKEAIEMNQVIRSTLLSAKFPLWKYISNSSEFLTSIDQNLVEIVDHKPFESGNAKVLGLKWTPESDELGVSYKPQPVPDRITKRELLSNIASVFDILGILSPVTIRAKLLMQQLWREKIEWNNFIPIAVEKEFRHYLEDLGALGSFSLKRQYSSFLSNSSLELIGFCDASNKAYCAVIYIRIPIDQEKFDVSFVCSKTKVAPLKPLSIPRLELQAAHLLAKLLKKVETILSETKVVKYAFSDSTTVLSWLNKPPETWKQFVANRVRKIQKIIPSSNWRYINTNDNPVDLATRGISTTTLHNNLLWIKGSNLIYGHLPSPFNSTENEEAATEQKLCSAVCIMPTVSLYFIENCSSYNRLIGGMAYVLRIIKKNCSKQLELVAEERASALILICRMVQRYYYPTEVNHLQTKFEIHRGSSLLSLSPFLHSDGLLRVGGRLRKATLPNYKHPIILPAKSRFVELYVRHLHERNFHATKFFIVNFVNSNYWIVGNLKAVVKKIIHQCVTCRWFQGKTCDQIMGQLPEYRINMSDAFTNVGIDFAGPLDCKCTNHRTMKYMKVYIAIFVCMLSRAVHIEVISNLTTASFIDSLKRFVSRRGLPKLIMSDNGRTFVSAKNYLDLTSRPLSEWAASEGITWKFIPPRAPHQGGLWEAAVKSAKTHLNRILKGQILSFEDYTTIFAQIEAILNSRPLNYRRDCDKSIVMITPAHLAIGRPLLFVVEEPANISNSLGARANALRQIINSFWSIWRTDYLAQLPSEIQMEINQPKYV